MIAPPQPDPSESRTFLRDVLLLLGIPLVLIVAVVTWPWIRTVRQSTPYEVPPTTDIFQVLKGAWDRPADTGFCRRDPGFIWFTDNHAEMVFQKARGVNDTIIATGDVPDLYLIKEFDRHHIRSTLRGDTARTEAGRPVVWDLDLISPDSFQWHRLDWAAGEYSGPVVRCGSVPARSELHNQDLDSIAGQRR